MPEQGSNGSNGGPPDWGIWSVDLLQEWETVKRHLHCRAAKTRAHQLVMPEAWKPGEDIRSCQGHISNRVRQIWWIYWTDRQLRWRGCTCQMLKTAPELNHPTGLDANKRVVQRLKSAKCLCSCSNVSWGERMKAIKMKITLTKAKGNINTIHT